MAIDTADKRFSMAGLALPFGRVMPTPDGSFADVADRTQLMLCYRGITPGSGGGGGTGGPFPHFIRRTLKGGFVG